MKFRFVAPILLLSAAACAVVNVVVLPHDFVFGDERRIFASAMRLAATGEFWVGHDRAWEMPGTAFFFAAIIRVVGGDHALLTIRFVQTLLLLWQAVLIGITAQRIFTDARTSLIALAATALYPFLLFYQGLLLSETLFTALLVTAVASLYWWRERGYRLDGSFVLTVALFGVIAMVKPILTLLPPLLMGGAAWSGGAGLRRAVMATALGFVIYVAILVPWGARNYAVLGHWVTFTTSAGENLYLGNNRNNPRGGIDWTQDVEPDVVQRLRAVPDEVERQRAFQAAAIAYIEANPGAFLRAMGSKFLRFWNPVLNAEQFRGAFYLLVSGLSAGPVLALALVSVVRNRRLAGRLAPIYALIVYFTLVHAIIIASLRYRLPLEPFLILLAAEPVARLSRMIGGRLGPARKAP